MADWLYQGAVRIVPRLAYGLMWLLFSSYRVRRQGFEVLQDFVAQGNKGIAAFWHYSFLYTFHHLRDYPSAVMVSASKDGEYIARLAQLFHHLPIRGSSNQRGVKALREMIAALREGHNAGIVADGSQGPARRVQAGCILMASKSGEPIFPIVWAADRCLIFHSWDRTVLPLPFARVVVLHGEPLWVPAKLNSHQIEEYRQQLEVRLNTLYQQAWAQVGRPLGHDGETDVAC